MTLSQILNSLSLITLLRLGTEGKKQKKKEKKDKYFREIQFWFSSNYLLFLTLKCFFPMYSFNCIVPETSYNLYLSTCFKSETFNIV